jgi:hypothetical protein
MAQGLKSLAGGNTHAALHRLGKAKQALLDAPVGPQTPLGLAASADTQGLGSAPTGAPPPGGHEQQQQQAAAEAVPDAVSRAVQLATVCGCLGDCYPRLGEHEQAQRLYSESVAAVQPYSEEHAEAAHAMSVSLNK